MRVRICASVCVCVLVLSVNDARTSEDNRHPNHRPEAIVMQALNVIGVFCRTGRV